jgi:hypothetical protein
MDLVDRIMTHLRLQALIFLFPKVLKESEGISLALAARRHLLPFASLIF